jgi:hypothetical protein
MCDMECRCGQDHSEVGCLLGYAVYLMWQNICILFDQILGAFAKLQKAIIFIKSLSVLPIHMQHLGSHWRDFYEI